VKRGNVIREILNCIHKSPGHSFLNPPKMKVMLSIKYTRTDLKRKITLHERADLFCGRGNTSEPARDRKWFYIGIIWWTSL